MKLSICPSEPLKILLLTMLIAIFIICGAFFMDELLGIMILFLLSVDCFKGKITGKYHISLENLWFPVDFPINQSIPTGYRFLRTTGGWSLHVFSQCRSWPIARCTSSPVEDRVILIVNTLSTIVKIVPIGIYMTVAFHCHSHTHKGVYTYIYIYIQC